MARTNDNKSNDIFVALTDLSVLGVVAMLSVFGILRLVDHFRPRVGDMITFDPMKIVSPDTEPRLKVEPAGRPRALACILDARTMRMSGGSLIIEAIVAGSPFRYRVHWAGGPTGDGLADCGVSTELLLSQEQLIALKMAAGR